MAPARNSSADPTLSLLATIAGPITALAAAPVLARALGPEGRGEVAGATATALALVAIAAFGLPDAVSSLVAKHPRGAQRLAARALRAGTVLGILVTAGALAVVAQITFASPSAMSAYTIALTSIAPTVLITILRARAAGLGRWRQVAIERTIGAVSRLATILTLAIVDQLTPVTAALAIAWVPLAGALIYGTRRARVPAAMRVDAANPRLLRFAATLWAGSIAGVFMSRLDQVLLGPLAGQHQLGIYAVAATIGEVPILMAMALRDLLIPRDSRDPNSARMALASRVYLAITVISTVLFAILGHTLVTLLFGEAFASAYVPALLLMTASTIAGPGLIVGAGLIARGHGFLRSASVITGLVTNVVCLVALAPSMGAVGAAIATLAANFVGAGINISWALKKGYVSFRDISLPRRGDLVVLTDQLQAMRQAFGRRP